jgi:hypothetical protein
MARYLKWVVDAFKGQKSFSIFEIVSNEKARTHRKSAENEMKQKFVVNFRLFHLSYAVI